MGSRTRGPGLWVCEIPGSGIPWWSTTDQSRDLPIPVRCSHVPHPPPDVSNGAFYRLWKLLSKIPPFEF